MTTATPDLPHLRQDLQLHPVERDVDGRRRWLLHDPVAQRFFRLGEQTVQLLPFIDGGAAEPAAERARRTLQRPVSAEQLATLAEFLRGHHLVVADVEQQRRFQRLRDAKPKGFMWLLKHYLFIRVPLANPDRWLGRHLNKVAWLGRRRTRLALAVLLVLGAWLTLRQWDNFWAQFAALKAIGGWLTLGIALVLVKALHELGHAFTCKAKGARVPTIGVAFIVGWPVLYTDTSDAWRLTRARDRVQIDLAGMAVEIGIAIVALLAWHILPDGAPRLVCFWLATTTWIMSVVINCNPLMRFDGYYLLSDLWRRPNLEPRSQALARWKLRELLFAFGEPPPEPPQRRMILFAFVVWVYRFFLFLGIALVVYHFFIKLIGIVLFAVEIGYFIVRPVYNEVRRWFTGGRRPRWNRALARTLAILAGALLLLVWPWHSQLHLPAFLQQPTQRVEAPLGGRLELAVGNGDRRDAGAPLAAVRVPETDYRLTAARARLARLTDQWNASGLNRDLLFDSPLVGAELATQRERVRLLDGERRLGELSAPADGYVQTVNPDLLDGGWVGQGEWVLTYMPRRPAELVAWIGEADVLRLKEGGEATFYPLAPAGAPLKARVESIEGQPVERLRQPQMATLNGGPIRAEARRDGTLVPEGSLYRVHLRVAAPQGDWTPVNPARRGAVVIDTEARSFLGRIWRHVVAVWRREAGF